MDQRKRSRDEFESQDGSNINEAMQKELREPQQDVNGHDAQQTTHKSTGNRDDGWETVMRSKKRKKMPKKESGNYPAISHSTHARLQSWVKLTDLQGLVLYVLADGNAPQWCSVAHRGNFRKAVVLMVPGLEASMFDGTMPLEELMSEMDGMTKDARIPPDAGSLGNGTVISRTKPQTIQEKHSKGSPDAFYPTKLIDLKLPQALRQFDDIFDHIWPIRTPGDDKYSRMHSPLATMLTSPVPKTKEQRATSDKGPVAPAEAKHWKNKRTAVAEFIVPADQLLFEGYVVHPAHFSDDAGAADAYQVTRRVSHTSLDDGWVDTLGDLDHMDIDVADNNNEPGSVTGGLRVLAVDCEMCITSPAHVQPPVFSLTRVSVTDWNGNIVLDELVKPDDPITNYLTPYSGITAEMMAGVTTTLQQAQQKLLSNIDRHTILVGHSLNSDLNALRITHPSIIDTALLYPHPRGPPLKSSLKWLAQKYLSRTIQTGHGSTGHDSVEDARTSLDLVKQKCEKGKAWGTSEASNESIFLRLNRTVRPRRDKVHPDGEPEPRVGAVVDWGDPKRGYGGSAKVAIGCKNDSEVVAGIIRAVQGDEDSSLVPAQGVDLVWGRLRELEAHRGWWKSSKTGDLDDMREAAQAGTADRSLADVVGKVTREIESIWESLPPCTAFIVYSGSGDPRKLSEMQELHRQFKTEYATKKWDQLSVKWTDTEEQEMRRACEDARRGIAFIAVK